MKYRQKFLLSCATLAVLASFAVPAKAETLADTIATAIAYHPTIAAKQSTQSVLEQDIVEQRSAYFPTLSANASTGRQFLNNNISRGLTASGGGDYSWLGEGSISASQMIFDAHETSNRVAAAKARKQAAVFEAKGAEEDVALRAARAHINMMRTKDLIKDVKDHIQKLKKYESDIKLMYDEGALDEAELLQAQELMVAAKSKLLNFKEQHEKARTNYIEAVGHAPGATLKINAPWQTNLPINVDTAVNISQTENPQLDAADKNAYSFSRDARAEKARLLPRLNAEMSYSMRDQHENVGGEVESGQAVLRLSWNFSAGGAEKARAKRALKRHNETLAKKEELMRSIEQRVRTAYVEAEISRQQKDLLTAREIANEKIVEKFRQQFEAGTRTTLQIMNVETRLLDSRADRINGHYRYILTNMQLLSSMGRLRHAILTEYGDELMSDGLKSDEQKDTRS